MCLRTAVEVALLTPHSSRSHLSLAALNRTLPTAEVRAQLEAKRERETTAYKHRLQREALGEAEREKAAREAQEKQLEQMWRTVTGEWRNAGRWAFCFDGAH